MEVDLEKIKQLPVTELMAIEEHCSRQIDGYINNNTKENVDQIELYRTIARAVYVQIECKVRGLLKY